MDQEPSARYIYIGSLFPTDVLRWQLAIIILAP